MGSQPKKPGQLRLVGPFAPYTGYAVMARAILRAALCAGYEVQAVESDLMVRITHWADGRKAFEPHLAPDPVPQLAIPDVQRDELHAAMKVRLPEDAPTILMQLAGNLANWPHYSYGPKIGLTMTESDNLCHQWRHGLRSVDFAAAPSTYCLDTFRRAVPLTPSELLPLPVDDRLWEPEGFVEPFMPQDEPPPFLFLSIFSTCERKQWRTLMTAFAEEFRREGDQVGLVVKPTRAAEVCQLADWCREMGAWIKVDTDRRNDYMMAALYRACKVYVQPASEGFGLPYIEAAMCGLPSIALDMGGAADVVSEDTGYVVPARMEPLIGHMPQFYDRKEHRFATCDIDDLRRTLRRAYEEERAGADKGLVARKRALQRFTPEAIAPRLVEVVERGVAAHRQAVRAEAHPEKPRWATVAGAWGDVFCALGKVRQMMADKEMEQIGLLWYGKDPKIADWLRLQPWVREVVGLVEPDKDVMTITYGYLCQTLPAHGRQMWKALLDNAGVSIDGEIAYTHLCLGREETPQYWRGAVLSSEAHEWAENVTSTVAGDFLLLNPLSIASNVMRDHWPRWSEAIGWLLDNAACPVVMVSERLIDWPKHPNLVNVTGTSRSMQDVMALAERAAGIVTTSNNLAHYAVIAGKPCVCVAARTFTRQSFYHHWNATEPITIVNHDNPLGDFIWSVRERLPHLVRAEDRDRMTEAEYYDTTRLGRA